jgi:hypothetical protein
MPRLEVIVGFSSIRLKTSSYVRLLKKKTVEGDK